jgi:hypothetical protein
MQKKTIFPSVAVSQKRKKRKKQSARKGFLWCEHGLSGGSKETEVS